MLERMRLKNTMKIAITLGDPSGIGPELILKTLPRFLKYRPLIYGNREILKRTAQALQIRKNFNLIKDFIIDTVPSIRFQFGKPYERTGRVALNSIESALADKPDILITPPIVKGVIKIFNKDFIGHTEFLADYFKVNNFAMVGILSDKRVIFLTTHLPLVDVPKMINKEVVYKRLKLFDHGLKLYLGIKRPKICVSSLNPHSSEFGYGEEDIIKEGINFAKDNGINAQGPFPADSIFNREFDGYLVMYHDQGFIYLKSKKGGVNWTLGLPIIRLSPLYGAALDIAGKNIADIKGMVNAIKIGIKLYRNFERSRK